jgi:hypothetical protein
MTFYDVQARTYLLDLAFRNPLPPVLEDSDEIDISAKDSTLPSNDKLLVFYSLENDLKASVNDMFKNYILEFENETNVSDVNVLFERMKSNVESIADVFFNGESGVLNHIDTMSNSTDSMLSESDIQLLRSKVVRTFWIC